MGLAMVPYVVFDIFALQDPVHWTPLSASFILLDGAMGVLGLMSYFKQPKAKGA